MLKRVAAVSLGLLCSPIHAESLLDLYQQAKAQDPVYQAALEDYQASLAKVPQARAQLLPQVGLQLSAKQFDQDMSYDQPVMFPQGKQSYRQYQGGIEIRQSLYERKRWIDLDQAELDALASAQTLKHSEQNLILRVASAYFKLLQAEDQLSLIQAQKAAVAEQRAMAERNFQVGRARITDTNEAEARFDLISAQQIQTENEREIQWQALRQLLGKLPNGLQPLKTDLQLPDMQNSLEHWLQQARQQNPQLAEFDIRLQQAGNQVRRNRSQHGPRIDLVAGYQKEDSGGGPMYSAFDAQGSSIGVELTVPIYSGGAISAQVTESLHQRQSLEYRREAAARQLEQQTRTAYLGVVNGLALVKALNQALKSSASSVDSTQTGLSVGLRTQLDLLNAQQQWFSAKRDLAGARYSYLLNGLQLQAAAGQLDVQDLNQINQLLDTPH